jgi:adenylate kinase family enzyme
VKRIVVTGPAGAGKSGLACELGGRLGVRVLHLDTLFWKPGWVPTPRDEFEAMQRRALEGEAWIVDAQYDDMLPDWVEGADTVVFVDASLARCLWRVSRRRFDRQARVGTPAGSEPGSLPRAFLKFLRNQWRYRRRVRRQLRAELARERDGRRVVVLRRPRDAAVFLDSPTSGGGTF